MTLNIREGVKNDLGKIVSLRLKLWEFEKGTADFAIKIPKLEEIEEEILKYIDNSDSKIYVAEVDGNIIGFQYGNIEKAADYFQDYTEIGYLEAIFIEENYRGKGLGKQLLQSILDWFDTKNIKCVQLGVIASNIGAIEIYKNIGFKTYYCKMIKQKI